MLLQRLLCQLLLKCCTLALQEGHEADGSGSVSPSAVDAAVMLPNKRKEACIKKSALIRLQAVQGTTVLYASRCYVVYEKLSGYQRVPLECAAADVARAADAILKASRCCGSSVKTRQLSLKHRHVHMLPLPRTADDYLHAACAGCAETLA